jgi:glucose/arabinose dehydrogenase
MILRAFSIATAVALLAGCGGGAGQPSGDATGRATAPPAAASGGGLRLVRVISGLDSPLYVTGAPGKGANLYVVEQPGRIVVVRGGRVRATFLDISNLVKSGGEQGLLSVAFHPQFATNRLFYVDYTDRNGDTRVVEYRARPGKSPVQRRELLFVDQPYPNHNGGQLQFGPDGYLYVGMGDGGSAGDPGNRAQNLGSRLGKLLKIDVDAPGADWQIVGYGLRNPWRFSFDRKTGDLWIGDVGQDKWEEIDFTPRSMTGLVNYGWRTKEGDHAYSGETPNPAGTLRDPIYEYSHDNGNCSVTGGYVYRGSKLPSVRGRYFFGDFCTGRIVSLVQRNGQATGVKQYGFKVDALSSFGQDNRGELYLVSLNGSIYRLA